MVTNMNVEKICEIIENKNPLHTYKHIIADEGLVATKYKFNNLKKIHLKINNNEYKINYLIIIGDYKNKEVRFSDLNFNFNSKRDDINIINTNYINSFEINTH